jgi:hypothetical protein
MSDNAKSSDENSNDAISSKMDLDISKSDNETDEESTEINNGENSTPTLSKQRSKSKSNLTPADRSLRIQTKIESAKKKEEKVKNLLKNQHLFDLTFK